MKKIKPNLDTLIYVHSGSFNKTTKFQQLNIIKMLTLNVSYNNIDWHPNMIICIHFLPYSNIFMCNSSRQHCTLKSHQVQVLRDPSPGGQTKHLPLRIREIQAGRGKVSQTQYPTTLLQGKQGLVSDKCGDPTTVGSFYIPRTDNLLQKNIGRRSYKTCGKIGGGGEWQ